jgi:hypothetical protein
LPRALVKEGPSRIWLCGGHTVTAGGVVSRWQKGVGIGVSIGQIVLSEDIPAQVNPTIRRREKRGLEIYY